MSYELQRALYINELRAVRWELVPPDVMSVISRVLFASALRAEAWSGAPHRVQTADRGLEVLRGIRETLCEEIEVPLIIIARPRPTKKNTTPEGPSSART